MNFEANEKMDKLRNRLQKAKEDWIEGIEFLFDDYTEKFYLQHHFSSALLWIAFANEGKFEILIPAQKIDEAQSSDDKVKVMATMQPEENGDLRVIISIVKENEEDEEK